MQNEIKVSFLITGFECSPEEITSQVSIKPTDTWKRGDKISPRGKICYEFSGWEIKSSLHENLELEPHIINIKESLKPRWEQFVDFGKRYDSQFSCVISIHNNQEGTPSINLTKEVIHELSQLNASLDIDLYTLADD